VTIDTLEKQAAEIEIVGGDVRFTDPNIAASVLGDILTNEYGTEWLDWEPETKWQTIKMDFDTDIHPVNKEKINAVATLLLVDDYWKEWHIFEAITKALNNEITSFYMMEGCSPAQMAWSVEESSRIRVEKFDDEVAAYVRANCLNHGYVAFPMQLSFAQGDVASALEIAVQKAWSEWSSMKDFEIQEDAIGVQLARLNSVRHYVDFMREKSNAVLEKGKG